jgi:hypothetical protein
LAAAAAKRNDGDDPAGAGGGDDVSQGTAAVAGIRASGEFLGMMVPLAVFSLGSDDDERLLLRNEKLSEYLGRLRLSSGVCA